MQPSGTSPARRITESAAIAALYVTLTWLSSLVGLSGGVIQFRLSEMLCILPCFTPAAIPGLAVGCLLANLLTGALPLGHRHRFGRHIARRRDLPSDP